MDISNVHDRVSLAGDLSVQSFANRRRLMERVADADTSHLTIDGDAAH